MHTIPTPDRPAEADLYSSQLDICHKTKFPHQIRGIERTELASSLKMDNPSVVLHREYASSDPSTLKGGNLMKCATLETYQKIGTECRRRLDRDKDSYVDIFLRQKEERETDTGKKKKAGMTSQKEQWLIHNLQPLPFRCNLYSVYQLQVLSFMCRKTGSEAMLHFDATGSIVKNINEKDIYLYSGVVHFEGDILPICEILTDDHTAFSIERFFEDWNHFAVDMTGTKPKVKAVVVDYSKAMMKGCMQGLNKMELSHYINHCWRCLQRERGVTMDGLTLLVICTSHLTHIIAKDAEKFSESTESKNFKKEVMASIITAPSWSQIVNVFRESVIIFESEFLTTDVREAQLRLRGIVKNGAGIKIELKEYSTQDDELEGVLYRDSDFYKEFHKIKKEVMDQQSKLKGLDEKSTEQTRRNPLYASGWTDHIISKFLFALPLVSYVLLFGMSKLSNQAVENYFRREKHVVLKGKKRLRPGEYIENKKVDIMGLCKKILVDPPKKSRKRLSEPDIETWRKRKKPNEGLGKKKRDTSFDLSNLLDDSLLERGFKPVVYKRKSKQSRGGKSGIMPKSVQHTKPKNHLSLTQARLAIIRAQLNESLNCEEHPTLHDVPRDPASLDADTMQKNSQKSMSNIPDIKVTETAPPVLVMDASAQAMKGESLVPLDGADIEAQRTVTHVSNENNTIPCAPPKTCLGVINDPKYHLIMRADGFTEGDAFVCCSGKTVLMRSDFSTLRDTEWLTSPVIDAFLATSVIAEKVASIPCTRATSLLDVRGVVQDGSGAHCMDEATLLEQSDDIQVVAVKIPDPSKGEDLVGLDHMVQSAFIAMPYNINRNHWILLFADVQKSTVRLYDPLGGCQHLENVFLEAFKKIWNGLKAAPQKDWKLSRGGVSLPRQRDTFNCGVFMCQAVKILCGLMAVSVPPYEFRETMMKDLLEYSSDSRGICPYCGRQENRVPAVFTKIAESRNLENKAVRCTDCRKSVHMHCILLGHAKWDLKAFICACCSAWRAMYRK